MMLPPLELCYIWNVFSMMYGNETLINGYLDRVNAKYLLHNKDKGLIGLHFVVTHAPWSPTFA